MNRRVSYIALVASAALIWACASDRVAGPARGQGQLAMTLTDAPLPLDSVKEVNVFVERIDARRARPDSAAADKDLDREQGEDHERPDSTLWVTIATPNKAFNLLALQNGVTAFLGATVVDTGSFKGIRLVIDPARSTVFRACSACRRRIAHLITPPGEPGAKASCRPKSRLRSRKASRLRSQHA